jgi:hypothetical protein
MSQALSGIYVPLDVLLDTRIGTIAKLGGDDLVLKVLTGNYHHRMDDKFPGVDVDAYNALYANRDVETLALSTLTEVLLLLRKIVTSLMKQALTRPFHEGVRIVVNTYPYSLSEEDTAQLLEVIALKMEEFTTVGIPFKVETTHLSDAELTPDHCKSNYSGMLMYDYENWLSTQQQAIMKKPMTEVTLYAPAIYHVQTPTEEQLNELKTQFEWNPFEAIEKAVSGGVSLQLLPIELFSVVKPT